MSKGSSNGKHTTPKLMQLEKVYAKCDWCEHTKQKGVLYVPGDVWEQWRAWTVVYPEKELLALFEASPLANDNGAEGWHITRIWLPKQRVTSVECEILESSENANGMIHSHHHMQARMSTQDMRELLPAYALSAVSNHAGAVEAYERVNLPCGGIGFKELEVLVDTVAQDGAAKAEVDAVLETLPSVQTVSVMDKRRFGDHLNDPTEDEFEQAVAEYNRNSAASEFPLASGDLDPEDNDDCDGFGFYGSRAVRR